MTNFHLSGDAWMRCAADKRAGYGVQLCPLGLSNEHHAGGLPAIALAGGGTMRRWVADDTYRETVITPNGDGTFTTDTGKLKRVYAMDGTLLPLKARTRTAKAPVSVGVSSEPEHVVVTPESVGIPKSPQTAEQTERLVVKWEELTYARRNTIKQYISFYLPRGLKPESLIPYLDADKNDLFSSYVFESRWLDALARRTGESVGTLEANARKRLLDSGDTNSPYWKETFFDWLDNDCDRSRVVVEQIAERFGEHAMRVANWSFRLGSPKAAQQRDALKRDLEKHFEKQGTGQRFTFGSPYISEEQYDAEGDSLLIRFDSKSDLLKELREYASTGYISEIEINQFEPATPKYRGFVVITPKQASLEEMLDLV